MISDERLEEFATVGEFIVEAGWPRAAPEIKAMARELLTARKLLKTGIDLQEDSYQGDYPEQWCVDLDDWQAFEEALAAHRSAQEAP